MGMVSVYKIICCAVIGQYLKYSILQTFCFHTSIWGRL